ncbi:hypothetical protein P0Y35_02285 [Kiritimatiellaeota bacterium B1221]|nr:hypothetical protein [Kiritimatiellaeota bacterium B1221]
MQAPSPLAAPAQEALNKLQALCPMRFEQYVLGEESLQLWTACDIDPLLNSLVEKDNSHPDVIDERMPYWAELWPSSFLLAETILENKNTLQEGTWLELGCGPALPGTLAAKMGRKGICSDYMEEALWLACLNAHQNHCEENISYQQIDWRTPPDDLQVSWIMAGDVAYETRNFEPLYRTFEQLLKPNGVIWLSEPGRTVAKPFFEGMKQQGWKKRVLNHRDGLTLYGFQR